MNEFKKLTAGLVFLAGWMLVAAQGETNAPAGGRELKPGPDDGAIAVVAASLLQQGHYARHPFDNEFSSRMLDLYLNLLDPQHMHFLQSDLDKFEPYRDRLDDLIIKRNDTWPAYEIFSTFIQRLEQRTDYVEELLATNSFDFTSDERVVLNRKDLPAPEDLDAARQLWLERLRFEYLQEKLVRSGKKKKDVVASPAATNGAPAEVKPVKTEAEEIAEVLGKRARRNLHIFEEMDHDDVFEFFLTSMAHAYDPHSDYLGKSQLEQFQISMSLALFGIGAQLQLDDDGYCVVNQLMPGGPAIKSKLIKEKERIVAVAQSNAPPVDVVGMNLNKTVQLIRGPKGSEVRLTLESSESLERHVVTLIRDEIPLEEQQAKAKIVDLPGVDGITNRVGVIDLPSFYASFETPASRGKSEPRFTSTDVALLIGKMKAENVAGIILDLRRNGGGSLEEAIKLTGLFIKTGPVVQVRGPTGDPVVDSDEDPSVLWEGPLAVMTSRFSASASEIVAAALQDYGRALIVGDSATHGKGTVQSLNSLNRYLQMAGIETQGEPGALKYTIKKFYRASGASTQFKGVTPDIVLPSVLNYSKDIGEGSLDYPLAWDTIKGVDFDKVDRVAPYLDELKKGSDQRTAQAQDFDYIREDIAQFVKRQEDKSFSLNEKVRLKEKDEEEARQKARDKERLARKGPEPTIYEITLKQAELPGLPLPVEKTNSIAGNLSGGAVNPHAGLADSGASSSDDPDEEKAPAVDPALNETELILVDYMHLLEKVVTAKK